jgi:hypothetical protein
LCLGDGGQARGRSACRGRTLQQGKPAYSNQRDPPNAHLAPDQDVPLDAVIDLELVQLESRRRLAIGCVRVGIGVVPNERRQLSLLRRVHVYRELAPLVHSGWAVC